MERLKLYEKKLEALKRDAEELLGAAWDRGDAMDLFEYLQEVLDDLEWEVEEEPDRLLKWESGIFYIAFNVIIRIDRLSCCYRSEEQRHFDWIDFNDIVYFPEIDRGLLSARKVFNRRVKSVCNFSECFRRNFFSTPFFPAVKCCP